MQVWKIELPRGVGDMQNTSVCNNIRLIKCKENVTFLDKLFKWIKKEKSTELELIENNAFEPFANNTFIFVGRMTVLTKIQKAHLSPINTL